MTVIRTTTKQPNIEFLQVIYSFDQYYKRREYKFIEDAYKYMPESFIKKNKLCSYRDQYMSREIVSEDGKRMFIRKYSGYRVHPTSHFQQIINAYNMYYLNQSIKSMDEIVGWFPAMFIWENQLYGQIDHCPSTAEHSSPKKPNSDHLTQLEIQNIVNDAITRVIIKSEVEQIVDNVIQQQSIPIESITIEIPAPHAPATEQPQHHQNNKFKATLAIETPKRWRESTPYLDMLEEQDRKYSLHCEAHMGKQQRSRKRDIVQRIAKLVILRQTIH
jgi:hypothetical protein